MEKSNQYTGLYTRTAANKYLGIKHLRQSFSEPCEMSVAFQNGISSSLYSYLFHTEIETTIIFENITRQKRDNEI